MEKKPIGLTRDSGWQMGLRKTVPVTQEKAWRFFLSEEGIRLWFGTLESGLQTGVDMRTKEGFEGRVTTFVEGSHFRMKWKKPGWDHFSLLQVRLMPAGSPKGSATTFAFHQDQLQDEQEREEMKRHWRNVMQQLEASLSQVP